MILTDCDIDRKILFKYMKKYEYNVHDEIFSIIEWEEHHNTYTMRINVTMAVCSLAKWKEGGGESYLQKRENFYFTNSSNRFDKFYEKELRNQKINNIVDGSN